MVKFKPTTETEFLAKQQEELKRFKRGERLRALLPERIAPGAHIYVHRDFAMVEMWPSYNPTEKLVLAANIVRELGKHIIEGEHWKSGCISTQPAAINSYAKGGTGEKVGAHMVEIVAEGGHGFGPNIAVKVWTRLGSEIAHVALPIADMNKMRAVRVPDRYGRMGDVISWKTALPAFGEDFSRKWASEWPAYSGSYYWQTLKGFYEWAKGQPGK